MALFSSTQPSLRARILPKFPAQVVAGNGITITKSGGVYTFEVTNQTGGSNTQVQFNDGGALGGDSTFTFDKNTNELTVAGLTVTGNITVGGLVTESNELSTQILALVNGANNNVAIADNEFCRITGPSGVFSISGFVAPTFVRKLTVLNTSGQTMTITNLATSTAANQINTNTGADVSIAGTNGGVASFFYSTTDQKWFLISHKP